MRLCLLKCLKTFSPVNIRCLKEILNVKKNSVKKREYQKVYDTKHKEEINKKRKERYAKEIGRSVITKASLKDALTRGLTDSEITELVRRM